MSAEVLSAHKRWKSTSNQGDIDACLSGPIYPDWFELKSLGSRRLQNDQQGEYRRDFPIRATLCQGKGEIFGSFNIYDLDLGAIRELPKGFPHFTEEFRTRIGHGPNDIH